MYVCMYMCVCVYNTFIFLNETWTKSNVTFFFLPICVCVYNTFIFLNEKWTKSNVTFFFYLLKGTATCLVLAIFRVQYHI